MIQCFPRFMGDRASFLSKNTQCSILCYILLDGFVIPYTSGRNLNYELGLFVDFRELAEGDE